jgi:hypothetical protein
MLVAVVAVEVRHLVNQQVRAVQAVAVMAVTMLLARTAVLT